MQTKVWEVADEPTGSYALSDGLAVDHGKRVTVCEIAAPNPRRTTTCATRALAAEPFGRSMSVRNSDDGVRRSAEFDHLPAAAFTFADGTPQDAAGVMLNIIEVREPGR